MSDLKHGSSCYQDDYDYSWSCGPDCEISASRKEITTPTPEEKLHVRDWVVLHMRDMRTPAIQFKTACGRYVAHLPISSKFTEKKKLFETAEGRCPECVAEVARRDAETK